MFNIKTWIDRVSEFPTRRLLTKVSDGTSEQVIVTRDEGTVTTAGDTFDANTMNNLEARIASAFTADEQKMGDLADLDTSDKSSLVAAINEAAQGGGGGGSSSLAGLTDTSINAPTNGQVLTWSSLASKWINADASGGADVSPVIFHLTTSEYFEDATSSSDWTLALENLDGTGLLDADAKARIEAGAPMYATFTYKSKDSDQPYDWGLYFPMQIFEENTLALRANDSFILLTPDESENYLGYYTALFEYSNDAYGLSSWLDNGRQFPSSDLINLASVPYDNTNSGLSAVTAQYAIDEVAAAVGGKAETASPAFTGTPTAPTPTADDDSTKIATTAFVQTSHEYQIGESISIAGMLCPFWQTGSTVRIFVPLTKTIASAVTASSITQTGNFEIRNYQGTAIATQHPLSDYGTLTFYKLAGGIGILISNLNSTWGDASRYTAGYAYANAGNTIKLGTA